jgi:RNA polymerase sigma-70 factor, ECF subfamily
VAQAADPQDLELEAELVRRAQRGDQAAFGELVRHHYSAVFRRVAAILRNEQDAKEVCQDIWLTVWENLNSFRGDSRFSTWVFPIATRKAIDRLRKRRRWFDRFLPFASSANDAPPIDPPTAEPSPREQMEVDERGRRFESAIAALPPKLQAVLAMREIEGLSYEEIARNLNCKTGTVMSRLFTARRVLAKKLGDLPCE